MPGTRTWLLLAVGQLALLALLAAAGTTLESRAAAGAAPPAVLVLPLRVLGVVALVGFVASVPPLMVSAFVAGQVRIGNAAHPLVAWLARHQATAVRALWGVWVLGALVALPVMLRDLARDREAPRGALAAAADDASAVTIPAPGTPPRDAILDAVRARLGTTSRFRVDHVAMAATDAAYAFVRATEVVDVDGPGGEPCVGRGECELETDLTVMALLELAPGGGRAWRVVELWTLPTEAGRPRDDFLRRVRARTTAARLPAALLPHDLR